MCVMLAEAGVPVVINALDNLPGSFDGLGARLGQYGAAP